MLGYKIAGYYDKTAREWKPCMVFLEIPEDATIVRPGNSKKHRCDKARVLNIVDLEDRHTINEAISIYILGKFFHLACHVLGQRLAPVIECFAFAQKIPGGTYSPNDVVKSTALDMDMTEECASGIHFFLTEEDAKNFYETPSEDGNRSWVMAVLFGANMHTRRSRLRQPDSGRF